VGSILLLVLGSVPAVSQLMPGALVGWAGQLTLPDMPVPSGGALGMGLVFIIVFLISAVAVFEQQEL
ncbi:MAG: hypothetical protein WAM60_03795, partial [Candidatus Promineifilaceae bacterium]